MFLKNRNISSKIKRSKITDYAALIVFGLALLSNGAIDWSTVCDCCIFLSYSLTCIYDKYHLGCNCIQNFHLGRHIKRIFKSLE